MDEQEIRAAALHSAVETAQALADQGRRTSAQTHEYVLEIAELYAEYIASGPSEQEEEAEGEQAPTGATVSGEEITAESLKTPEEDYWDNSGEERPKEIDLPVVTG